jgi:hypothetical protein
MAQNIGKRDLRNLRVGYAGYAAFYLLFLPLFRRMGKNVEQHD